MRDLENNYCEIVSVFLGHRIDKLKAVTKKRHSPYIYYCSVCLHSMNPTHNIKILH
jgi:hypothetical protein